MLRFLARTRLAVQLREAREAYRALRIAQHRASFRAKRAAVRAAVFSDLRRSQFAEMTRRRDAALALAALRARAAASDGLRDLAAPPDGVTQASAKARAPPARDNNNFNDPAQVKEALVARAEALVPEHARGVAGGRVLSAVLRATVSAADVDVDADRARQAAQVVASIAAQTGCSEREVDEVIQAAAAAGDGDADDDADATAYLRENVRRALRDARGTSAPLLHDVSPRD